jgi:predicted CXXCH cytochrome family protein
VMWAFFVLLSTAALAQESAILRPMNQTVVPLGTLMVVARGPASAKMALDGIPVDSQQPAPGTFTANLKLSAGRHELTLGTSRVQFAVGNGPADWKQFRQHPPFASCSMCHAVKVGEWGLRSEKTVEICAGCHDLKSFPKLHMHNTEVLKECQECHMPHGSAEKSNLKMNKETACKLCHG